MIRKSHEIQLSVKLSDEMSQGGHQNATKLFFLKTI